MRCVGVMDAHRKNLLLQTSVIGYVIAKLFARYFCASIFGANSSKNDRLRLRRYRLLGRLYIRGRRLNRWWSRLLDRDCGGGGAEAAC